jgi:hypothetical protein
MIFTCRSPKRPHSFSFNYCTFLYISLNAFKHSRRTTCCNTIIIIPSGVRLSPLGTAATTGLLYQPQMIDDDDCGAIGAMKIGRGSRSTRRKPAPAPLCPPQIPHDQTRARTRVAAVESHRLTAWAIARPDLTLNKTLHLPHRVLYVLCVLTIHNGYIPMHN